MVKVVKPFYAIKFIVGWLAGIYYMLGWGGGVMGVKMTDQDGASSLLTCGAHRSYFSSQYCWSVALEITNSTEKKKGFNVMLMQGRSEIGNQLWLPLTQLYKQNHGQSGLHHVHFDPWFELGFMINREHT